MEKFTYPDKGRRTGKCPLTPVEVGFVLRALGFGSDVNIYVASGEVYGGEETLAPLKALFPHLHSKDSLAKEEELAPFSSFSSRMAALDFIVCDESDVFVTNNNGNMAKMLAGRRRYFGHKRTIRPNARKLYSLFLNRANMTRETFASKVRSAQRGFMGEPNELRPGRGEFHENPSPCICKSPEPKADSAVGKKNGKVNTGKGFIESMDEVNTSKGFIDSMDDHFDNDEPDWSDMDYLEDLMVPEERGYSDGTELDYDPLRNSEDPELEEIISD